MTKQENHAINIIVSEIQSDIEKHYNLKCKTIRNSPIVSSENNYDNLYYPKDTITKSSRYTRWIDSKNLLRTHTTSGIPDLLKSNPEDGIYLLPGIVYRRDVIDKTHVGEPHQLDIWKISKDKYTREDLIQLVSIVVNSILPGSEWRYSETSHYYTKDGIEIEVLVNGSWLEILECGLILPKLLDDCGLNSSIYSGLAMGIGLDRAVMIRKGIKDIRILRSEDERILSQLKNLDQYKDVSSYPHIKVDLSIAVEDDMDNEILGDKIRDIVSTDIIEEIIIKSETGYEKLPKHVSERLGMSENMKNILIGITYRSIDRSLTKEETNILTEIIYKNIHRGKIGYL